MISLTTEPIEQINILLSHKMYGSVAKLTINLGFDSKNEGYLHKFFDEGIKTYRVIIRAKNESLMKLIYIHEISHIFWDIDKRITPEMHNKFEKLYENIMMLKPSAFRVLSEGFYIKEDQTLGHPESSPEELFCSLHTLLRIYKDENSSISQLLFLNLATIKKYIPDLIEILEVLEKYYELHGIINRIKEKEKYPLISLRWWLI